MPSPAIVWFRRDLRLIDNPAWAAAGSHRPVTALFVIDPALFDRASGFRVAQLCGHLAALDVTLMARGGRLRVETGDPGTVVPAVAAEIGATVVFANADATPYSRRRDTAVNRTLGELDPPAALSTTWGTMVHHPGAVLTQAGRLSLVFTPFSKVWSATPWMAWPEGDGPTRLADEPGAGLPTSSAAPAMESGATAALARLDRWQSEADAYPETRDLPAVDGTSQLSADLRFGTISPRRVAAEIGVSTAGRTAFVRQLAWRDWYAHMLFDRPDLVDHAMKPAFDRIEWANDPTALDRWQRGQTGYPLVDAGMRQLLTTGWMHNRVRMVVASFLVKDLLIDWRLGERWFRHLLIDADVAQNVGNWQWAAGTGPDAAPYFRIFNPILQSKRFDPQGTYIRRFVPELVDVPSRWIHAPWEAPPLDLAAIGVTLGDTYPQPMVDHTDARDATLAAYAAASDISNGSDPANPSNPAARDSRP